MTQILGAEVMMDQITHYYIGCAFCDCNLNKKENWPIYRVNVRFDDGARIWNYACKKCFEKALDPAEWEAWRKKRRCTI